MDGVKKYLAKELNVSRNGGRISSTSVDVVVVKDCPKWCENYTRKLRCLFPYVDVDVEASDSSLSGFMVVVRRRKRKDVLLGIIVLGGLVAVVTWTLWNIFKQ